MPYQGTPTGPRPSAIDRSPRPGSSLAALMLLAAGCAAAEETPTELRTASLQGCAGGGPADGKHVAVNDMLEAMARDLRTVDDGDREDVPSRDEMRRLVEADQRGFAAARRAAGVPDAPVEPLTWVSDQHERTLGRVEAAAALGLDPEMFGEALDASGAQVPAAAMVLRQDDGRISRATWNQIYPDMVEGLGLGMPCDPDGAGSCP